MRRSPRGTCSSSISSKKGNDITNSTKIKFPLVLPPPTPLLFFYRIYRSQVVRILLSQRVALRLNLCGYTEFNTRAPQYIYIYSVATLTIYHCCCSLSLPSRKRSTLKFDKARRPIKALIANRIKLLQTQSSAHSYKLPFPPRLSLILYIIYSYLLSFLKKKKNAIFIILPKINLIVLSRHRFVKLQTPILYISPIAHIWCSR